MTTPRPLPLLNALRADARIQPFLKHTCAEHGVGATLSPTLRAEEYVIISPDGYYNSLNIKYRPKSPDCLVVVRCADGAHKVFVIELKDIDGARFEPNDIREKFSTCLGDLMSGVLGQHFNRPDVQIRSVKLYFVAAPYGPRSDRTVSRTDRTTKLDVLLTLPPFLYNGRRCGIEHKMPDPLIQPC